MPFNPANRQSVLSTEVDVAESDFVANVANIPFPAGAKVIGGEIDVVTVFDAATTDVLDVGDKDDPDRYIAAANLKAAGRTAALLTGYRVPHSDGIVLTRTPTGAATAVGLVTVTLMYVIDGRSTETQE